MRVKALVSIGLLIRAVSVAVAHSSDHESSRDSRERREIQEVPESHPTLNESHRDRHPTATTTGSATDDAITPTATRHESQVDDAPTCRVWVAPSTIPGAGLGLYAGVDVLGGQEIVAGGDALVGIVDWPFHHPTEHPTELLWYLYAWSGPGFNMMYEGYQDVQVAAVGLAAVANCILDLVNVQHWDPQLVEDARIHRSHSPSAGSSTTFHHHLSTAKRDIAAGSELFVDYGENYFRARTDKFGPIPLLGDFERASRLVRRFAALHTKLRQGPRGDDLSREIWHTFVQRTSFDDSRVLRAASVEHDLDALWTTYQSNVTAARLADTQRSLDWLQRHGTCSDTLVGQPSTVPHAGRGAVATRTLPVDAVVSLVPLIPTRRRHLEMYPLHRNDDTSWVRVNDTVTGHQVLLNYCFGHAESTLLLCPYGTMAYYVNHNQSRANVRLQWSTTSHHRPELLTQSVETVTSMGMAATLSLELVATREIAPGDEVFLDYGHEWERAWHHHVTHWSPREGSMTYRSASQLNAQPEMRLRTVFEEAIAATYPDTVFLACDTKCHTHPSDVRKHHRAGTLEQYLRLHLALLWQCQVLRSRLDDVTHEYLYTVYLFQNDTGVPTNDAIVENVPRGIFRFVDKPGTSDVHLPNAFRHDMRLPDSLFPLAWRNIPS